MLVIIKLVLQGDLSEYWGISFSNRSISFSNIGFNRICAMTVRDDFIVLYLVMVIRVTSDNLVKD